MTETDMLMAKRGGIKGMLVLTGSSTEKASLLVCCSRVS